MEFGENKESFVHICKHRHFFRNSIKLCHQKAETQGILYVSLRGGTIRFSEFTVNWDIYFVKYRHDFKKARDWKITLR